MSDAMYKLVNPKFTFTFNEKDYEVRKATLEKSVQYQERAKALTGAESSDIKIVAYCIYLILKDVDPEITEQYVLENTPAAIDPLELLSVLGFMSPQQVKLAQEVQARAWSQIQTTRTSGLSSPNGQDGLPSKSESSPSAS